MTRLIDADKAIDQERQYTEEYKGDFGEQVAVHTIEILQHAPTVEAIPVSFIKDQIALAEEVGAYHAVSAWQALIADWKELQSSLERSVPGSGHIEEKESTE